MAVIGTFGSFTAARMGIYASQSSLNVTGNNIANINTNGYTRQRLDLVSLHSWGTARYANKMNMDVGYGVLTNGVSQLRDPFLDIRYRDEQANVGAAETWLDCLKQLSHTLDEVGDGDDFGILERQFNDFKSQLQQLNGAVGTTEYDTTARSSAEVLCNLLNSYAKALDRVESTQLANIKDDVTSVNTILTQIRSLNEQIREAGLHGAKALELRDERNVLIDELSKYMKIEVSYDMEKLDEFNSVERLNINIANSGNPPIRLICGTYGTQLGLEETVDPDDPNAPDSQTAPLRNSNYNFNDPNDPANVGKKKYIKPDGSGTDDPKEAMWVDNCKQDGNEDFNRLWMHVQPLENKYGRVFRDADGVKSTREEIGENMLYGSLQSKREFLLGEGEFSSERELRYDKDANSTRGVPYFRKSLDALAKKFAEEFNRANTQGNYEQVPIGYETVVEADGVERYQMDNGCHLNPPVSGTAKDVADKLVAAGFKEDDVRMVDLSVIKDDALRAEVEALQNEHLSADKLGHGKPKLAGGVLFSSDGDADNPKGITAANITISKSWSTGETRILNTKKFDKLSHSTADDNIAHMINLMESKMDYLPQEIDDTAASQKRYFNGTFQERFADMNVILSVDQETTTTLYNSYSIKSLSLENDRQSVSGVDLNDEATNMMVFQKSYAAACQLMTTLDSMLDKLINGTLR